jgi:ABC-2 type transport system ATP-binding protein
MLKNKPQVSTLMPKDSGAVPNAVEVNSLGKTYGALKAVDSVSLSIKTGSIFGLLGPNGAGKTTLISMLVTMRRPTSGRAEVNGFDVSKQPGSVRRSIGIVFQDPSLDEELTALENLEIHAAMYGVPKQERARRIEEVAKLVGLEKKLKVVVKTFSGGMKRRLEIARGLVHSPKILFLDEPTLGLDPQTRAGIWEYIKRLNEAEKITIILTTHYMDEADGVCSRIAIIDAGKIIAMDSPENLKNALGGDVVSIKCSNTENCTEQLSQLKWVKSAVKHDGFIDVRVEKGEEKIPKILQLIEKQGITVESVSLRKPSLDDVFLHYTGRTIREEEANPKDAMKLRRRAWGHGR